MRDIQPILDLINSHAAKGIMLPRTKFELSENIRDFLGGGPRGSPGGVRPSLQFYSPVMGEVRSLAVAPEERTQGTGMQLVRSLAREAKGEAGELPLKARRVACGVPRFRSWMRLR